MSALDWLALVFIVPLACYGWWVKYDRKRRTTARARQNLLDDLRKGRV